jgi:magnesium transporter
MSDAAAGLPENPSANAIRNAMQAGRVAEVIVRLKALPPGRRAELFLRLRAADQKTLLAVAPPDLAASMLADCDSASLAPLLESYDLSALKPTLQLIPEDDLADILLHLPPERRDEGLSALDAASAEQVRALMTFDPESAGGLMTPRYLSVPEVVTAGRALELLRSAKEADSASYVYGTDAGGRLTGVIPLRQLLLANPRRPVSEAMVPSAVRLKVSTPRDAIVETFGQHHFVSLPVVDEKDRLVGIVTSEAVMKVLRRREESVLQGVTGVDPRRERLKQTLAATRGRLPWITVTIAGGLGCALIGKLFQRTLDEIVMVGIFTPLVLALGESVGAQTASVVLAGRDEGAPAEERKAFVLKELGIGVLVAVYAGVLVAALSHLWHGNARLGALIGGSVLLSMVWAVLLAVLVPGLLRRMKVNPAIASGPLVLTLADFSTLLLYFGAASASLELLKP